MLKNLTKFPGALYFIGENLKVCEEILYKIRDTFVEGKRLELELEKPPTGFTYGTVISTVAALMRAGKIIAKYNGEYKYSWQDEGVFKIFSAATEFRKASFKAVSQSLSLQQRHELAQFMLDNEAKQYIGKKIDYNTNDFELASAIRDLAKHFADKIGTLQNSEKDFNKLFPDAEKDMEFLGKFTGPVSEANYIDKANDFLSKKQEFLDAIKRTLKIEKFIRNKLPNVKIWKQFAHAVADELQKATKTDSEVEKAITEFNQLYDKNIVEQYDNLHQAAQRIKDRYHTLFSGAMIECADKYTEIEKMAEDLIAEINSLPHDLNEEAKQKAENLKQYAKQRSKKAIELEFDVKDKISRFTYSEILSFIDLYSSKKSELQILKAGLVKEKPHESAPGEQPKTKPIISKLPVGKMKIADYRNWLQQEMQRIAAANNDDEVNFE